jgi:hypothetical protein
VAAEAAVAAVLWLLLLLLLLLLLQRLAAAVSLGAAAAVEAEVVRDLRMLLVRMLVLVLTPPPAPVQTSMAQPVLQQLLAVAPTLATPLTRTRPSTLAPMPIKTRRMAQTLKAATTTATHQLGSAADVSARRLAQAAASPPWPPHPHRHPRLHLRPLPTLMLPTLMLPTLVGRRRR